MTADLPTTLAALKGRWMIGGAALDAAPEGWKAVLEGDPAPEVALLALAGQASQVALRPKPGAKPEPLPVLPPLSLPSLPTPLRPTFRRMVATKTFTEDDMPDVLHLMASRGFAVHPVDYMPKSFARLPDVYAPWSGWKDSSGAAGDTLTAENWEHWRPAERRVALRAIRMANPAEARALLEEKGASLAAEHRADAVALLSYRLGPDDQTYLESLSSDRSGKVKAQAERLLARLGKSGGDAEDLAEFAGFFTQSRKGFLKRSDVVSPVPLKTGAQRGRRATLFGKISLADFARSLGLDQVALVRAWESKTGDGEYDFVEMVAATGSDAAVQALTAHDGAFDNRTLVVLAPRLSREERGKVLANVLRADDHSFSHTRAMAGLAARSDAIGVDAPEAGTLPLTLLEQSGGYVALMQNVRAAQTSDTRHANDHRVKQGLFALGLLLEAEGAAVLLRRLTDAGMFAADPALGLLSLNASLKPGA